MLKLLILALLVAVLLYPAVGTYFASKRAVFHTENGDER